MKSISAVNPNILDPKHALFEQLKFNPPVWWNILKQDPELYVEIRKYNVVEVYYQGGTLAKLVFDKKTNQIKPTAHPKYLGHCDVNDKRYYKNNNTHTPIYQDCSKCLAGKIEDMKQNIRDCYTEKHNNIENVSEKKIQGLLIINNRDKYLDSEFSHRLYEGERTEVRIDLVKIENNQIVFEELKKINDYRLHTTKDSGPEILQQMSEYDAFISKNQIALRNYYMNLIDIKKSLELPLPNINDISKLELNPKPVLVIADNYDYVKMNPQRAERIEAIKQTLKKDSVNFCFLDKDEIEKLLGLRQKPPLLILLK